LSARHKLNGAYLTGGFIFAGLVGLVTGSMRVFAVTLFSVAVIDDCVGNIRLRRRP
jgi:hypothetical protein